MAIMRILKQLPITNAESLSALQNKNKQQKFELIFKATSSSLKINRNS